MSAAFTMMVAITIPFFGGLLGFFGGLVMAPTTYYVSKGFFFPYLTLENTTTLIKWTAYSS